MNSSWIGKIIAVAGGLFLSLWVIVSAMGDTMSGGIGMALKCMLAIMVPAFFVNPRFGLYTFVVILANIEWVKRYCVFFGVASVSTVAEMLVIPIILLSVLILSMFAGMMMGTLKMSFKCFGVFLLSWSVVLVILGVRGLNTLGIQSALNAGLYISIIPVLLMLMKDEADLLKFMRFCVWMFLPWALWGIKQYYWGLSDVENYYVGTFLSPVLSGEVLRSAGNPRPFGLASSQASYGAIAFLTWCCCWHALAIRKRRFLYVALWLVYFAAVVLSGQRTALLMPLVAPVGYFLFQRRAGVVGGYALGMLLLGLGIAFSGDILKNLDRYQENIAVHDSGWGEKTLRISTYSDRLRGWERLKNPKVWSLFGKRLEQRSAAGVVDVNSEDYAHDMINGFLLNVGLVGLLPCLGILGYTIYRLHALVFMLPAGGFHRRMAAGALAYSIPNLIFAIMGGGNFNTTPINFFTWLFFGMALIVARDFQREREARIPLPDDADKVRKDDAVIVAHHTA